jgi:putative transposase
LLNFGLGAGHISHGIPEQARSDKGPEFTAKVVRQSLGSIGVKTLFIEPGSPWENGYSESFNGKLRDEVLNREVFFTLQEAKIMIENWRQAYNTIRPDSSLDDRPPALQAVLPLGLQPPRQLRKFSEWGSTAT